MTIQTIIGGIVGSILTICVSLILLPRFRKHAHWRDTCAPMSLRSRILLPLFPACITLAIITGSSFSILAIIAIWILLFLSFHADRRRL